MQQTRLETDTLALGMAKEVDSAGVATVRTREGEMAAELRGAVSPVLGRATEPAPCGKDGLETNLGAAPAGGAPGKSDSAFNGAEIEAFMRQRYYGALAGEAAEAAAEAAQLKAQLTAPPGLPAVEKTDATVAVVTPPPSEDGEEHSLEETGDVPASAGGSERGPHGAADESYDRNAPWYLAIRLENEIRGCAFVGEPSICDEMDACLDAIEAEQAAAAAVAAEAIRTTAREHEGEKAQEPPKAARGAGDARKRAALTLACAFRSALARRRVARPAAKRAGRWREIAEENPNGAQYSRLRYWMRTCVFGLTADETGTALVALLCGCWWAAPVGRQLVEGVGVPSTCAACGATSECLAVHLLLGQCGGEAACSCPETDEIRQRWEAEVDDLYTAHANSHPAAVAEYLTAPPRSLRRVALMIGRARGVKMPWDIASELPRVFTRTWGAWSRLKLEEAAGAAAG